MSREDIIRIAREAGGFLGELPRGDAWLFTEDEYLVRFAALVIANHPPQSFMTWQEGYESGKQNEREACAKVCDAADKSTHPADLAEAIRARGQA
jgi:hypothetical protein